MAWIELHDNLPDHPKTLAVARALDMDKDMVVGKLCRLWTWCLANREDGLLALEDGETLCEVMRFTGGAKKLMQALCTPPKGGEAGFIEPTPGGYRLHGWEERTSLLMETRARKRAQTMERTRRYRERRKEQASQGGGDGDAVGDAAVTRHGDAGCDAAVTQCDAPTEPNPTEPYPTEPNPLGGIPPREVRGKGREQEGPPAGACAGQADAGRRRDRAEAQARRTLEDGGAGAYVGARKAGESVREQREENGPDEGRSECEPMRAENETPVNGRLLGQRAAHGRHGEAGWQRGQGACGLDMGDCERTDAKETGRLEDGGAGAYVGAHKAGGSAKERREESGPDEGRSECEPMRAENETPVNGRLLGQRAAHGRHGEAGWQRGQGACGLDMGDCERTDAKETGRLEDGGAGAYEACKAGESAKERQEENGPDEGRSECEPMRAENETPVNGRLLGQRAAHEKCGEAGWQRGQGACGLDCARTDAEEQGGAGTIPHEEKAGFADGPGGMPFALEAGAVFTLPARDGEYALGAAQIGQLQAAFPELDLAGELRAMDSWLRANPQGVRPAGMMPRFVDGWLRNAQKRVCRPVARGDTVERFLALAQQMERET
ncbi:hypothetical protein H8699_09845 [Christensenellaceae bacterium NSJ-44]|uniref:Uncharacterized protein n=1 Tax=Luoshenia tenuis TaxID=2763654 RepID=A0A926HNJ7_9FIRM|nr:hypothetical protein [Luoshenia tenuis]MBC8529730.1 hypothetical protein [Luoshenia tenuis]